MSQLPSPLSTYVSRFNEQYVSLQIGSLNQDELVHLMLSERSSMNNLFMAGMGASTLILRLGAVIQLSTRLENGTPQEDALLMKQILENLSENLPSDTSWKTIWSITCNKDSKWQNCVIAAKGQQSLLEKFITFRNKYVHGYISLNEQSVKQIAEGLSIIYQMVNEVGLCFEGSKLEEEQGKYYFSQDGRRIPLYPFLQRGTEDGLPYIFQGLYSNKTTAELISTYHGDVERQDGSDHYETVFDPMRKALKGGTGSVFDHSNRIAYYSECFVGRDIENKAILDWAISKQKENILPIFSSAGMGKGALIANVIQELQETEINMPVLYHFCGSGIQNSLHATLYHFILQGKKQQLWQTTDELILRRLDRLPSKYEDLIMLFHRLLDECFVPSRNNLSGNIAIILDGLDEAAVAYPQLHMGDWFNTYDEDGEVTETWKSKVNIRWIFTYREGFYRFPTSEGDTTIETVQPLAGLSEKASKEALAIFNPSSEFLEEVIKRGAIV